MVEGFIDVLPEDCEDDEVWKIFPDALLRRGGEILGSIQVGELFFCITLNGLQIKKICLKDGEWEYFVEILKLVG